MGDYNVFHIMPWSGAYSIYFFVIGISAAMFFFRFVLVQGGIPGDQKASFLHLVRSAGSRRFIVD